MGGKFSDIKVSSLTVFFWEQSELNLSLFWILLPLELLKAETFVPLINPALYN